MDPHGTMHSRIEVPKEHPAFPGHFPNVPVLPGAVLLDEVLTALESQRGIDITQWRITSAKFLEPVRPGDDLRLEHEVSQDGSIRFVLSAAHRKIASGSLSKAAPPNAAPPVESA
jgi:3-hydroxyacyl-[acyl-carrier-protein] dehydratase